VRNSPIQQLFQRWAHAASLLLVAATISVPGTASSQDPIGLAPPTGALRASPEQLLAALEAGILEDPSRYDLRWGAAREYANAAAVSTDQERIKSLGRFARDHAMAAIGLTPENVEGHYWLGVASGILAEAEGGRTKVRMAEESWNQSGWVLQRDSLHAGAHHLQGRIHAAVMRVSGVTRFLARMVLGGDVLGQANWVRAEYHLRRAADLEPAVAMHHFELAMTYRDLDRDEEMLEALQTTVDTRGGRLVDDRYRERAQNLLIQYAARN
jgi:hypothetical protein